MFKSIVVGTDGSDTATEAVRQAADLARSVGAKVELVSAYEPVPEARLREERKQAPEDLQWAINPREDVDATLEAAAAIAAKAGRAGAVFPPPGHSSAAHPVPPPEPAPPLILRHNRQLTRPAHCL